MSGLGYTLGGLTRGIVVVSGATTRAGCDWGRPGFPGTL